MQVTSSHGVSYTHVRALCVAGADSLAYLSVEGLVQAVRYRIKEKNTSKIGHCTACLTGNYPEKLEW